MEYNFKALSAKKAKFVLALAHRIVPETSKLGEDEKCELLHVVDDALAARGPSIRIQMIIFLEIIRWSPFFRFGKPLEKLTTEVQDELLAEFQNSLIPRVRTGFWGLKTLIFMGYYGNCKRWGQIHYTPVLNGNEKLHV